ncbi:hypothetical protein PYW08_015784 [Mythimna loreyi]|uniref:Uncharacterized protein n=1 Tax=Mythimna loreyi TaxID=667449 RepID=A0ACC2QRT1_9NEOP|nr:hypothetical protein PYW08_015784 [Mythimna loreyi]
MALRYVNRFYSVCYLVLFLAISAVADTSLEYYNDNQEPQRSVGHIIIEDCGTTAMRHQCYRKCGKNIACLLNNCFCLKLRGLNVAEDGQKSQEEEDVTEEKSYEEENLEPKMFYDDEEDEQEPLYNYKEIEEQPLAVRRHHIAHFCPNLGKARACIRKCMKQGVSAFCGKDHVCYCSHKYQNTHGQPKIDPQMVHNQFRDLYEKYFGRDRKKLHRSHKYTKN